jgi:hypothetical protein
MVGRFLFAPAAVEQSAADRPVKWLRWQRWNPERRAFVLGWCLLFYGGIQLAAAPGSHHLLMWARLLAGSGLTVGGVSQLWIGLTLRRKHRKQLLQAVAMAVSVLEQRRREKSDSAS